MRGIVNKYHTHLGIYCAHSSNIYYSQVLSKTWETSNKAQMLVHSRSLHSSRERLENKLANCIIVCWKGINDLREESEVLKRENELEQPQAE